MNQLYRFFLIVCVASLAAACNRDPQTDSQTDRRTTVTIDCAGAFGVDVRTFIEGQLSDGNLEIGWDEADRFRLWSCRSGDGTPATSGTDFALYHYDMTFPVARFKGEVDLSAYSAGDTYDYYAVSPAPASEADVRGTLVSYTIPAVQTGEFDGKSDILTAQLFGAPALAEGHNPDIRLQFQHRVHVLRIAIPENRMGEDVRAMELSFPSPVAGRLTVDASGRTEPVLTEGSSVVRLNFAEPKRVGDVVYVTIAPTTIPAEGVISMRIIGRTGETSTDCLGGVERTMAAGHFSPVKLHVPQMKMRYTRLTFRLPADRGVNTLGEAVNKVKITPSGGSLAGATLPDNSVLSGSELTYAVSSADGRDYSLLLMPDVAERIVAGLNGKAMTATFESESAQNLTSRIVGKTLNINAENIYDLSVPYLYEERFDGISSYDYHSAFEGSDGKNPNPIPLDSYGLLSWSGTRVGLKAGTSIRIMGRTEIGMYVKADYNGRVDSAPIAVGRLKSGKKPKVAVSFDYCTDRYNGTGSNTGDPLLSFGYMTQGGIIPLDAGVGTAFENGWKMSLDYKDKKNADHYGDAGRHTYGGNWSKVIPACTEEIRLSWFITNNHARAFGANGVYYIYIDNVKAKIVK